MGPPPPDRLQCGGMDWGPISEDELLSQISDAEEGLEPPLLRLWEKIRIRPIKWALPPWGDLGGGFWVVGIIGQECVWYNDIEDGFERSPFDSPGAIGEYRCSQFELSHILWQFRAEITKLLEP